MLQYTYRYNVVSGKASALRFQTFIDWSQRPEASLLRSAADVQIMATT